MQPVRKAVVLAAGAGKRMREDIETTTLAPEQASAAQKGAKAMMPLAGRPFLDYVLSSLVEAGIGEVGLVVGPDHAQIRKHYTHPVPRHLRIDFLVQEVPMGTAHALLSAEGYTRNETFLLINGDNYYPPKVLARLAAGAVPALAAYSAESLLDGQWTDAERNARLCAFADVHFDEEGYLLELEEKPAHVPSWVSMNSWCLGPEIYKAAHSIQPSARGEWELPSAVMHSMRHFGTRYLVHKCRGPVLDLSRRSDVARVQRTLVGLDPNL